MQQAIANWDGGAVWKQPDERSRVGVFLQGMLKTCLVACDVCRKDCVLVHVYLCVFMQQEDAAIRGFFTETHLWQAEDPIQADVGVQAAHVTSFGM